MKVTVDGSLCTGCSLCVSELPEVFEMGSEGLATVIIEAPKGEMADKARDTAGMCPASAINIED
jgi:ferredoxin